MRRNIIIPTLALAITLIATPALAGWEADIDTQSSGERLSIYANSP